jgi:hypothetical protein
VPNVVGNLPYRAQKTFRHLDALALFPPAVARLSSIDWLIVDGFKRDNLAVFIPPPPQKE